MEIGGLSIIGKRSAVITGARRLLFPANVGLPGDVGLPSGSQPDKLHASGEFGTDDSLSFQL
jgi:hypothetical protein